MDTPTNLGSCKVLSILDFVYAISVGQSQDRICLNIFQWTYVLYFVSDQQICE